MAAGISVLFIIDCSERTGQSWHLLHRACIAIVQSCQKQQQRTLTGLQCGLLLVRGCGAAGAICTPSGFTSDDVQFRRWLRGVLFDGGPLRGAHLEAMLTAAAQEDWWEPGFARHAVLVTHVEPAPLPASTALAARALLPPAAAKIEGSAPGAASGQDAPATAHPSALSCWSPVPEVLAAARIALSLIAPRAMPRLSRLHAAVCAAAATRQPHPMRFPEPEATELLVVSPLLDLNSTDAAMGARVSPNGSARSPVGGHAERAGRGAPQGGGGGVSSHELQAADVVSKPVGAKRRMARGEASSKALRRIQDSEVASTQWQTIWNGSLVVQMNTEAGTKSQDLGTVDLAMPDDGDDGLADKWREQASASWGKTLRISMLEEGPRVARLRELVAQHAGSALRLSFGPRRKAGEFFDTMRLAGQWVQLAIPTTGYGAFIDAAVQTESRQILKGWILRLPQGGASGAPAPVTHHPSSASDIEESPASAVNRAEAGATAAPPRTAAVINAGSQQSGMGTSVVGADATCAGAGSAAASAEAAPAAPAAATFHAPAVTARAASPATAPPPAAAASADATAVAAPPPNCRAVRSSQAVTSAVLAATHVPKARPPPPPKAGLRAGGLAAHSSRVESSSSAAAKCAISAATLPSSSEQAAPRAAASRAAGKGGTKPGAPVADQLTASVGDMTDAQYEAFVGQMPANSRTLMDSLRRKARATRQ